jgi:prepilin-type processing-associated H-X9-DG protein
MGAVKVLLWAGVKMKRILLLLFTGSLLFIVPSLSNAQPSENARMEIKPGYSVNNFFRSCAAGHFLDAAKMVYGANPDDPALAGFGKEIAKSFGEFELTAQDFKITLDPKDSTTIKADFTLILHDQIGHSIAQADSATLKKNDSGSYTFWMVVAEDPETLNKNHPYYWNNVPPQPCGLTTWLATEIAHPAEMQAQIHLSQSESQLKQLGLGLMQLCMDYNQIFQLDPQHLKRDLFPYLQSDALFTAPGDVVGTVSYHINSALIGKNIADIKNAQTLVTLYLGKDQKLDFRYGGLSPVCFADGHVKAVTPEEAKSLRWEP